MKKTSWAIVHFLEGKFEKSFAALRAVYDKVQGSISFLNYNNEFLLDFIKFYSDISFFNKNYAAVENLLAVSYTVSMANDMYLGPRSILHFLIKNRLYSTTTQYQKVDELLAQHQTDFEQWLKTASEETCTVLNAGLAISYFIAQNYAEALYYANNLINTYTKSSRQEVVAFAYIFESVIAYELNEFQTFDSKIKNAIAFFYRYPQHKEIGHEMLSALQSAFGKPTRAERRRMFEKLLKSLRASEHKISKQVIYNYFDFPAWFEAQIAGLRYQDYRKKIAAKV